MPSFSKVSHISFSATDADASAAWWIDVFGFSELDRVEGEGWQGVLLLHAPTKTIIELQQHEGNGGEAFDPRRTGFDHMGFKVGERQMLEVWKAHFEQLGVAHSPIADREYGSVLTFKDPDGIQFEMFYREGHP